MRSGPVIGSRILNTCFDCADSYTLAQFWSAALHIPMGPVDVPGTDFELGPGTTLYDDQRKPDGTGWAVRRDPAGNELCVLRSAAERAAES